MPVFLPEWLREVDRDLLLSYRESCGGGRTMRQHVLHLVPPIPTVAVDEPRGDENGDRVPELCKYWSRQIKKIAVPVVYREHDRLVQARSRFGQSVDQRCQINDVVTMAAKVRQPLAQHVDVMSIRRAVDPIREPVEHEYGGASTGQGRQERTNRWTSHQESYETFHVLLSGSRAPTVSVTSR